MLGPYNFYQKKFFSHFIHKEQGSPEFWGSLKALSFYPHIVIFYVTRNAKASEGTKLVQFLSLRIDLKEQYVFLGRRKYIYTRQQTGFLHHV